MRLVFVLRHNLNAAEPVLQESTTNQLEDTRLTDVRAVATDLDFQFRLWPD
ncbi:hypothetical protein D3C86_2086240 [compost metagenome]